MTLHTVLTHPGGAHKDDFLACALLIALHGCRLERREPEESDLLDPAVGVVDVGGRHEPELSNFDHHQFGAEGPLWCALSLVLMDLGLYDDARAFCEWLETAERFDVTGPNETAAWLGVDRATLAKLNSPVDVTLLRRFAKVKALEPGEPLHDVMRWIGEDLLKYLREMRQRLDHLAEHSEIIEVAGWSILFLPRTDPLPDEPSAGIFRFLESRGLAGQVVALVYPDRRGSGYGLSRNEDHPAFDFTRIIAEPDVHFAHARGFVAKTSATSKERLIALLEIAATGIGGKPMGQ
ncbi:MAG: MYG1 family protein [Akkermansiaceae bacterium]|jgi:hypothetical protein|nr:MYG1 family protein [Akkermansiaceae bacterium]